MKPAISSCEELTIIKWINVSPHNKKRELRNYSRFGRETQTLLIFLRGISWTISIPNDQTMWRNFASMTLLPSTRNVVKTVMEIPFTGNLPNPFFQITRCTTQPRRINGRSTTTHCFSCSFPSAMKQTSLKRERLPSAFEWHLGQNDKTEHAL